MKKTKIYLEYHPTAILVGSGSWKFYTPEVKILVFGGRTTIFVLKEPSAIGGHVKWDREKTCFIWNGTTEELEAPYSFNVAMDTLGFFGGALILYCC